MGANAIFENFYKLIVRKLLKMSLSELFDGYKKEIENIFLRIINEPESKSELNLVPDLVFTSNEGNMLFRCVPSEAKVLIDWKGIASLWATSQAIGRLSEAIFNGRRNGATRLDLSENPELELGYHFIEYSQELCNKLEYRWNTYFPKPDISNTSKVALNSDKFFFLSIEWILRHELGHILLSHNDLVTTPEQSRIEEYEADRNATKAIKGNLVIDDDRDLGARPSDIELELERSALAAGIALIWVGIYEDNRAHSSAFYPKLSDRIFECINQFNLANDSAACEILSDFIKSWVDPEGDWSADENENTAMSVMHNACFRLDEYLRR